MKLLIALLFIQTLYGEIAWQKCNPSEIQAIKDSMLTFYSEQLVQGDLFENSQAAKEAAILEWDQEEQNANKEFFYYHLIFRTSQDRCGYLIYSIEHPTAYLDAIYLETAYRGQGLGRQVLQDLEVSLRAKKVECVKLYVFAHNHQALDLYKKIGYQIETTYSVDQRPIGHHMKKELFDGK
jgi:ribosomal protein S18 acetylase RimI-like enzyme